MFKLIQSDYLPTSVVRIDVEEFYFEFNFFYQEKELLLDEQINKQVRIRDNSKIVYFDQLAMYFEGENLTFKSLDDYVNTKNWIQKRIELPKNYTDSLLKLNQNINDYEGIDVPHIYNIDKDNKLLEIEFDNPKSQGPTEDFHRLSKSIFVSLTEGMINRFIIQLSYC